VVSGLRTQELFPAKTSDGLVFGVYGLSDLCDLSIGEVCRSAMWLAIVLLDDASRGLYLVSHDALIIDQVELPVALRHVYQGPLPFEWTHNDRDYSYDQRGIHHAFATPP